MFLLLSSLSSYPTVFFKEKPVRLASLLDGGCGWQTKPHRYPHPQRGRGLPEKQNYDGDAGGCKRQENSFAKSFITPRSNQQKKGLTVLLHLCAPPRSVPFLLLRAQDNPYLPPTTAVLLCPETLCGTAWVLGQFCY